jgi:hypothetical protein
MTGCPPDSALRRLGADALPVADASPLERHLDSCDRCRERLDALAGVTAVGAALGIAGRPPASADLSRAMNRLRTGPTDVSPAAATWTLPPTARLDFLGRLGAIEVRRLIGRGGMGLVYEGFDPALNRPVVVKVLSPHLLGDGAAKERFLREARAAAALTHEHVVTIHAIDQHDGVPYLVLQYVAGESLADRLARDGKLPVVQVARIGGQVARGLAAAHSVGLIHRDVKPANVLLDAESGDVRLTDFGLAKLVGGGTITGVGTLAGTPAYMSPEQAAGGPVDARSDLFGLGVVLYAAAAGTLPFAGDSPHAVLYQIRERTPTPLAGLDPALPPWFCSIVDRLLEKDPARRIQTAAEVADLLEHRTVAPRCRTGPWGPAVAVLVVVTMVAITVSTFGRGVPPLPIEAPQSADRVEFIPPGFVTAGTGEHFKSLSEAVKAAADGDTIEVHGDGPHLERRVEIRGKRLTIRAAAGSRPRVEPATTGKFADPQWIHTDSDLTLDGLDIHWPVTAGKAAFDGSCSHSTVGVSRGRLTVRDCQIVCGRQSMCARSGGHEIVIQGSHLVADSGIALWWRSVPGGSIRVTRSTIEAASAAFMSFPPADAPAGEPIEVELSDNTIVAKGVWGFAYPAAPKQTVRFAARRNLLSANYLFGVPTRTATAADAPGALRRLVVWTERDNVYDLRESFLAAIKLGPVTVFPAEIKTLDDWAGLWKAKPAGTIEGDIRFRPRPPAAGYVPPWLDRIDAASGPVPAAVGAPASRWGTSAPQ